MKTINILLLATTLLLTSCSNKMIKQLEDNSEHFAKLQQTQKMALMQNSEVYALLSATYLQTKVAKRYRATAKDRKRGEKFIVGLFFSDQNATIEDANITLNNQKPLKVKKLERGDKRLKDIPLLNSWSSYYLLKFKHINKKSVKLKFEVEGVGKKKKKFYKVARYLLQAK